MSVTLSKRLEAYAEFAKFCMHHNVYPDRVAEAIQLMADNRNKGLRWDATQQLRLRNQAKAILKELGFDQIDVINGELNFRDRHGDLCQLPKIV
jgi:hypothetical protein